MRGNRIRQKTAGLLVAGLVGLSAQLAGAQSSPVAGQAETAVPAGSTKQLLGDMVKQAKIIFAGEVYAIRPPDANQPASLTGVIFRVDQAVRGVDTDRGFVLKLPADQAKSFHDGERYILLLGPPGPDGSGNPVRGQLGILPVTENYEVDLARLHQAVQAASGSRQGADGAANAAEPGGGNQSGGASGGNSTHPTDPAVLAILRENQMLELDFPKVAFLAALRDLFVLAADTPQTAASPRDSQPAANGGAARPDSH